MSGATLADFLPQPGRGVDFRLGQDGALVQQGRLDLVAFPRQPLVSCLMVTRGRLFPARFAVDAFRSKTWPERELALVCDAPGTPIEAQTINSVVTERGGLVTAMIARDVWSAGFDCLAVPAGSTLTVAYGTGVTRGQKRIEIMDPTIVRPWPKSDAVRLAAMTADATGASGLPGRVEVPWFRTGVLIAQRIERAVDDAFRSGIKPMEFGGPDGTDAIARAVLTALG